jgi:hypothetical protein
LEIEVGDGGGVALALQAELSLATNATAGSLNCTIEKTGWFGV